MSFRPLSAKAMGWLLNEGWWGLLALAWGLVLRSSGAMACTTVTLQRDAQGVVLRWDSKPDYRYRIESSEVLGGEWVARGEVTSAGVVAEWPDHALAGVSGRYYRLLQLSPPTCDGTGTETEALLAALKASDAVPRELPVAFLASRDYLTQAVYFASQWVASGQVITTGTLTQSGVNWTYASAPVDRLVVRFQNEAAIEYWVEQIQGDFTGSPDTFLGRNHTVRWRAKRTGLGDLTLSSTRTGGRIHATLAGSYVAAGVAYEVDVASDTDDYFESSFGGSQTITDTRLQGLITSPGTRLTADARVRFEIVVQNGKSASTTQEWLAHRLVVAGDTFTWVDVKKQKAFKDGVPSELDSYWLARGAILRNGGAFGSFRKDVQLLGNQGGWVKFLLDLPTGAVEVESWSVFP